MNDKAQAEREAFEAWFSHRSKLRYDERLAGREGWLAALEWQASAAPPAEQVSSEPVQASSSEPPLLGHWHHGEGHLCSGSLRIARADFDTNPPEGFRDEVLDWVCDTLNAALRSNPLPAIEGEAGVRGGWQPIGTAPKDANVLLFDADDPTIGEAFFDHAESDCWVWANGPLVVNPTHWMPLPPAPEVPPDQQKPLGDSEQDQS